MPHALIIEDDRRNMQVLGNMLTAAGFTHIDIADPTQLKERLAALSDVDIVFLDLEMPDLNGYEVLPLLKADKHFQYVPIVACTIHANEISSAFLQGFHSFLSKPLDMEKFPEQVARIMRGERVWERN
jgi:CheY-like chemotaxis protein